MGRAKQILIVCNADASLQFEPYADELREAKFKVEFTHDVDTLADSQPLHPYCLILIQFAFLTTPNYHTHGTLDGACNGGTIARVLRQRGIRKPILLCNNGIEELTWPYHDPKNRTHVVHLHNRLPNQLLRDCQSALGESSLSL